jgi:carbonic anhydrase/acetyltransferase-like protein (isoleucine patch superfamily)
MALRVFEGRAPRVGPRAYVDESALVVGDVALGEDSSVWPGVVVRGDIHSIRVGARTNIQDGSVLHVTHDNPFSPGGHPLLVGAEVTVGHRVVLHGCTIEDRCLIGMGSIVMDGACIRAGVILGAGSLVPPGKDLAGGRLWLGRPARPVRQLTADEIAYLAYVAEHYVQLKERHARSGKKA